MGKGAACERLQFWFYLLPATAKGRRVNILSIKGLHGSEGCYINPRNKGGFSIPYFFLQSSQNDQLMMLQAVL
jgi:hypothetical protein